MKIRDNSNVVVSVYTGLQNMTSVFCWIRRTVDEAVILVSSVEVRIHL
jgi:hypothetical protein